MEGLGNFQKARDDVWVPNRRVISEGFDNIPNISDHAREWLSERISRKAPQQMPLDSVIELLWVAITEYVATFEESKRPFVKRTIRNAVPQILTILVAHPKNRESAQQKWLTTLTNHGE